jgi:hypothetical protein
MTLENLQRANAVLAEIEYCKKYIDRVKYTQVESVQPRVSYLKFNGIDSDIQIPDTLFKTIGKLVLSELTEKLRKLEEEFKSL